MTILKIIVFILLGFFLNLSISQIKYRPWDLLKNFNIHKFEIGDCVVHIKDINYPYKITSFNKNGYNAYNIKTPQFKTIIKYGSWEEDFFEKVDCLNE